MDEIALGLTVDAYSRTALSRVVVTVVSGSETVRTGHGLTIRPSPSGQAAAIDHMLPPPSSDAQAQAIERALVQIASRFDRPMADIVALVMEYPWPAEAGPTSR